MTASKRNILLALLPILIPMLIGGVAWAADHYIDERIDTKLAVIEQRLANLEKKLDRIGYFLGVPETQVEK